MVDARNNGRRPNLSTFRPANSAMIRFHRARPALIDVIWTGDVIPTAFRAGDRKYDTMPLPTQLTPKAIKTLIYRRLRLPAVLRKSA
jgi:hypothetical protein